MPTFRIQCVSLGGRFFHREVDATTDAAARTQVESTGAFVLKVREFKPRAGVYRTRLRLPAQIALFDLLAMQIGAGVPAEVAVAKLRNEFPDRRMRAVLRGVHAELASSTASLSGALAKYPRSFPEGIIAAIRVGEESGSAGLASRLEDLRDQLAFRVAIQKTTLKALAYPAFILCFASAVVGLLLVKLVPNLKILLDSLNMPLPTVTRAVLGISAFLSAYWLPVLVAIAALVIGIRLGRAVPTVATFTDRLLLRLPFLSGVYRALVTADLAKNYRALYSAGADAGATLSACAAAVRNRALKQAILRARDLLESGGVTRGNPDLPPITEALRTTGYFPELALTIIGTGETSGSLAVALDRVAKYYAASAQERVQAFFGLFDKVVMLALIGAVGTVVIGLWLPIMTAAQHLH